MPGGYVPEISWRDRKRIHDAIDSHLTARGVPDYRLSEMRRRWIARKGLRVPGESHV